MYSLCTPAASNDLFTHHRLLHHDGYSRHHHQRVYENHLDLEMCIDMCIFFCKYKLILYSATLIFLGARSTSSDKAGKEAIGHGDQKERVEPSWTQG